MSLTREQEQSVYNEARSIWLQTHSSAYTMQQMATDPQFETLVRIGIQYYEEQNRIRAEAARRTRMHRISQPISTDDEGHNRSDTAVASCPNAAPINEVAQCFDCRFDTLTVNKANDTNRVYHSSGSDLPELSVVAGQHNTMASIQCRLTSASVNCEIHDHRVWTLWPAMSTANLDNNSEINFSLADQSELNPFINNSIRPTRHRVVASTCNTSKEVIVLVYPDWSLEGSLAFRFNRNRSGRWEFALTSVSLEVTSDGHTTEYELSFFRSVLQQISMFMNFTVAASNILHQITNAPVTWEITPPTAELSISTGWQENPTNLECGYYVNASLGFEPFIGITWEIDLSETALNAILLSVPPLAAAYRAVSRVMSLSDFMQITLRINSVINYNFTIHYNSSDGHVTPPQGGVEGVITVEFEITFTVERITRALGINCEINAGVETGFALQFRGPLVDIRGGFISTQANFNGAAVYAGMEFSLGTSSTRPASRSSVREADQDTSHTGSIEHRYVILEQSVIGEEFRINL